MGLEVVVGIGVDVGIGCCDWEQVLGLGKGVGITSGYRAWM